MSNDTIVDDSSPIALKARWVFPVASPPIVDGVVIVQGERIAQVGPVGMNIPVRDLGQVAILPGLVNAHTHLEFSDLAEPLGKPGIALPRWIEQVIVHRRAAGNAPTEAIARGYREVLASGTTTVGDIATSDYRATVASMVPHPLTMMFREAIAPTRDRVAIALAMAEAYLRETPAQQDIHPALSPHAPYTVHPELLTAIVELCASAQVPVAMHLAESPEEIELLATRGGAFRTLLKNLDAWDPRLAARLSNIGEYLEVLSRAPRALVIHGNYLVHQEIDFLVEQASRMSVVYCPRTHAYFGHPPYPLAERLTAGVAMALGTDSRASNPDLGLWNEMRFVAAHHPGVSPTDVLGLGTRGGARALGLERHIGTIEWGKLANLAVIQLPSQRSDDPHELPLAPETRVTQTWLGGQLVFDAAQG